MNIPVKIRNAIVYDPVLYVVLASAAILLSVGLDYGLPLHLVGDEESLIGGALTMLELRQFIPAVNAAAFDALYYPVVIPYLITVASLPVLGFTYIANGFSIPASQDVLMLDLDGIWMAARLLSVVATLGLLSVTYAISKELFSRRVAIIASIFLSTSFFVVSLGHWIRHWPFTTLGIYGSFLVLLRYLHGRSSRWYLPSLISVVAVVTSYVAFLGVAFASVYAFVYRRALRLRHRRFFTHSLIVFGAGAGAGLALYYQDFLNLLYREDGTILDPKSIQGLFQTIALGVRTLMFQEPALTISLLACILFVSSRRRVALIVASSTFIYLLLLYTLLHFETRYVYVVVPLFAIVSGVLFDRLLELRKKFGYVLLSLATLYSLIVVVRYDFLLLQKDTRLLARDWMLGQVGVEMIVSSPQIIAPRTNQVLGRDDALGSVRATERYQMKHQDRIAEDENSLTYVNIHFWDTKVTLDDLNQYLETHRPRYAIIDHTESGAIGNFEYSLIAGSKKVAEFTQSSRVSTYAINGNFFAPSFVVFDLDRLGPKVEVYELRYIDALYPESS